MGISVSGWSMSCMHNKMGEVVLEGCVLKGCVRRVSVRRVC